MFQRLGLTAKLYSGFGAVLVLISALCAFLLHKFSRVSTMETRITSECIPGLASIGKLLSVSRENFELLPEHINARDSAGKAAIEQEMLKHRAAINASMEAYEKGITQAEDSAMFAKLAPLRKRYVAAREEVQAMSRAGRTQEANAAVTQRLRPVYKEYLAAIENIA